MADMFTLEEEELLSRELARGRVPLCPRCGCHMETTSVPPRPEVGYVRTRAILQCGPCGLRCVVDRK